MRARTASIVMGIAAVVLAGSPALRAGSLEPPGPPAPTMKTMDQVEPRTPVESLPGDGQYLHVISNPGSYYLSGTRYVPSGLHGIFIHNAGGPVTLDLRGFALMGQRDGLGKNGIVVSNQNSRTVTIRNGALQNWDGMALNVFGTSNATVEDLQVSNSNQGMVVGPRSVVRRCMVFNCSYGITGGVGSSILDSVVDQAVLGIQLDFGSRIEGCTVMNTGDYGIYLGSDGVARGNTLKDGNGIIVIGNHNTIDGNNCDNTGPCVKIETGTGNLVIRNSSVANATDFVIGAGNIVGPITSDPATAGPWANFVVD